MPKERNVVINLVVRTDLPVAEIKKNLGVIYLDASEGSLSVKGRTLVPKRIQVVVQPALAKGL